MLNSGCRNTSLRPTRMAMPVVLRATERSRDSLRPTNVRLQGGPTLERDAAVTILQPTSPGRRRRSRQACRPAKLGGLQLPEGGAGAVLFIPRFNPALDLGARSGAWFLLKIRSRQNRRCVQASEEIALKRRRDRVGSRHARELWVASGANDRDLYLKRRAESESAQKRVPPAFGVPRETRRNFSGVFEFRAERGQFFGSFRIPREARPIFWAL